MKPLKDKIKDQVRYQAWGLIVDQVRDQIWFRIRNYVGYQVWIRISIPIKNKIENYYETI